MFIDPAASHDSACSLVDIAHDSDLLLEILEAGVSRVVRIKYWTGGSRSSSDLADLVATDVEVRPATIGSILARRTVGPRVGDVHSLNPGQTVSTVGLKAVAAAQAGLNGAVIALATTFESDHGPLVRIVALVEDGSAPRFIDAGECTNADNLALARLTGVEGIFGRMVTETFLSEKLDAELTAAAKPASPSAAEQIAAQEIRWRNSGPESRPLQLGAVPNSLRGSVRVTGLLVDLAMLNPQTAAAQSIVVWSDLGVSSEIVVPTGIGPSPMVIPTGGDLRVSVRQSDGSLGEKLAQFSIEGLGRARALRLTVDLASGTASLVAMSDEEFAKSSGIALGSLDLMQASYESQIFFTPSPEVPVVTVKS